MGAAVEDTKAVQNRTEGQIMESINLGLRQNNVVGVPKLSLFPTLLCLGSAFSNVDGRASALTTAQCADALQCDITRLTRPTV